MYTTLISVSQLQALQARGHPLMVFDCSSELLQPGAGDAQYLQSHIAGSVRADLDRHLCAHTGEPALCAGRHPAADTRVFCCLARQRGVSPGHAGGGV